jgi:polysaccharide export outer membrane protein
VKYWGKLLVIAFCLAVGAGQADAQPGIAEPTVSAPSVAFEYRLGPGDKLRITVFGEDALSGEFSVSGAGQIAFPLVGDVGAAGLTAVQLQDAIAAKLRDGYIKEPRVSAEVLNYRPFYILGEVMKPGQYPYSNGLTVLNAVATAQGFTYRADTRRVYIKHQTENRETRMPLDPTTPVQPGDTIRIGERFF